MLAALAGAGCGGPPRPASPPSSSPCVPRCERAGTCAGLDARLLSARSRFVRCVASETTAGRLGRAHHCYRALRLIESARWWLRTLTAGGPAQPRVYRYAVETERRDFLCRVERLAASRRPAAVERRYLELIRAFP